MRYVWAIFGLLLVVSAQASTRVALVAREPNDPAQQLIALATAQLSQNPALLLLEREQIQRPLKEHHLSLSGLVDSQQAIEACRLIGAELFAVIDADPKQGPTGLIVFDAGTGLRLWDSALPASIQEAAAAIGKGVRVAAAKQSKLGHGVIPVGFLPVRNADLGPAKDDLCSAVSLLVERQLAASPDLAILERDRLEHVNKERALPTTAPATDLLASLIVVQIEISRGESAQELRAAAICTDGSGQIIGTVRVPKDTASPAELASGLTSELLKTLKLRPQIQSFNNEAEARRLIQESDILQGNGRFSAALRAAEAAFALHPDRVNRMHLVSALWTRANRYLTPDKDENNVGQFKQLNCSAQDAQRAFAIAQRALDYQNDAMSDYQHGDHAAYDYREVAYRWPMGGNRAFAGRAADLRPDQISPEHVRKIRAQLRQSFLQYCQCRAELCGKDAEAFGYFTGNFWEMMSTLAVCSTSIQEFALARDQLMTYWLNLIDACRPASFETWFLEDVLCRRRVMDEEVWPDWSLEAYCQSLDPLLAKMQKHWHPLIRVYGMIGRIQQRSTEKGIFRRGVDTELSDFLKKDFNALLSEPVAQPARRYLYLAAEDAIQWLSSGSGSQQAHQIELLNLMHARSDLATNALLYSLKWARFVEGGNHGPHASETRDILNKMLSLAQSRDCHVLDSNRSGSVQRLTLMLEQMRPSSSEPELDDDQVPWDHVDKVLDVSRLPNIVALETTIATGKSTYLIARGRSGDGGDFVQAFRLLLDQRTFQPLGRLPVTPLRMPGNGWYPVELGFQYVLIQSLCANDRNLFASVREQGIYVFPLDGSPAYRLDRSNALPNDWIQPLAWFDGKLYAGNATNEGGYLFAIDPLTRSTQTVISSLRKQKQSPLDDSSNLKIDFLFPDMPHNRLLIVLRTGTAEASGLWEIDAAGKMKQRLSGGMPRRFIGIDRGSLFFADSIETVSFNLEHNSKRVVSIVAASAEHLPAASLTDAAIGRGWNEEDYYRDGARFVIRDWLWEGFSLSRISRDGTRMQMMARRLSPDLDTTIIIQPLGDDRVVVGDARTLYLLHLRPEPSTQSTSSPTERR